MSMELVSHVCFPETLANQDYIFNGGSFVLLMDGSTPLAPDMGTEDVRAYVRNFAKVFAALEKRHAKLYQAVAAAIRCMRRLYMRRTGTDPLKIPGNISASLTAVRERDGEVEVFCLGDCTAVIHLRDGRAPVRLRPQEVAKFDGAVIAHMQSIRERTGCDISEASRLPEIRAQLAKNRLLLNTPQGYWILGFDERAAEHGMNLTYRYEDIDRIYLHSDGFDLVGDEFMHQCGGRPELMPLYGELCRIEEEDANLNLHPRFKKSDDASAAVIVFK